jgi:hypothetical protein
MKLSSDRVKKAPRVVGIKVKKPTLYEKVVADNKKNFDEVCKVATAVGEETTGLQYKKKGRRCHCTTAKATPRMWPAFPDCIHSKVSNGTRFHSE